MSRKSPAIEAAFPICKELRCPIAAWGPDSLVAEIKDSSRLEDLKSRLAPLGFHFHPDEDSQAAGLYDFSLATATIYKTTNQFQGQTVIRLPLLERYQFLVFYLLSAVGLVGMQPRLDGRALLLLFMLPIFFVYALRNFSWKMEIESGGLNIGSLFAKRMIPWADITSIESQDCGRMTECLVFRLRAKKVVKTRGMRILKARAMRDEMRRRREEFSSR